MLKGNEGKGPFGTTKYITDAGTVFYIRKRDRWGRGSIFTEDGERAYRVYDRPMHCVNDLFSFETYEKKHLENLRKY